MHTLWTLTSRTCKPRTHIPYSHRSISQSSALLLSQPTTADVPGPSEVSVTTPRNFAKRRKWAELEDSLSRDRANPSRVWNHYLELGSVMGFDDVPFEIQQQVLYKCVPSAKTLRVAAARRMQANNQPRSPHIYEWRLQTLIGHMRASGRRPTLDDYHFVLEQFAAVGHHTGARHVFRELTHLGVQPSYRTYGLCFQAAAHRLTLPCPFRFRPNMLQEANSMCIELLDDMWARRVPMTSVNFDLVHRVFKDTGALNKFEKLLKVGYGIDLANPDRPMLETQSPEILTENGTAVFHRPRILPFTTAALNTLIDMLGSTKQISRMVTAFEVFTTPLPPPPSPNSLSEDEEDDDPAFYQFSSSEDATPHELPSAAPNTTTFNLLIRYAAKANHAVLARHYVVQARQRDMDTDTRLRADLASKPLGEIASPKFAVNRGTFLPPFGMANRTRHVAFLRWNFTQVALAWRQKKEYLAFYEQWRQDNVAPEIQPAGVARPDEEQSQSTSDLEEPSGSAVASPSSAADPSADPTGTVARRTPVIPELSEALQVDLDAPLPPPSDWKPFNLDLHISLLTRDVEEIGELVKRMSAALERLSQRVKERLGRRIWQGKNIFLMDRNRRVYVNRQEWLGMVRFRKFRNMRVRTAPGEDGGHRHWEDRQRLPHLDISTRRR